MIHRYAALLVAGLLWLAVPGCTPAPHYDVLIRIAEEARARGVQITANMYTYTAGSTGLDAAMPSAVQAGGYEVWRSRLMNPHIRASVVEQMRTAADERENLMRAAGPEGTLLVGFRNEPLRHYIGRTLADVTVFDPASIQDHATYDDPHRYATGVVHVLVNGVPVLRDGEYTGAVPGRVVRGPGWTGWAEAP